MSQRSVVQRSSAAVHNEVSKYNELFHESATAEERKTAYKTLVANYYSLATDFYEYGWGRSFHFANRFATETLAESLQRHESYLALKMKLKPGDKVLDIGCGVGGPLRRMAYLSGAHITGVTISAYQIQRAKAIGQSRVQRSCSLSLSRSSANRTPTNFVLVRFRCPRQLSIHSRRFHAVAVRSEHVRSCLRDRSSVSRSGQGIETNVFARAMVILVLVARRNASLK